MQQQSGLTQAEYEYIFMNPSVDDIIINEELVKFKSTIKSYDKETPYYVYALCNLDGTPFYIGKGRNLRPYQHIKNAKNNNKSNIRNINHIKSYLDVNSYPIIYIIEGNLSSKDAVELESYYINYFGRIGFESYGILTNIMPNHIQFSGEDLFLVNSYAGKLGGKSTKENKSGIFSEQYDRSSEAKRRWKSGIISKESFFNYDRSVGGNASVKSKKGIHADDYNHSEMSKLNWMNRSEDEKLQAIELCKSNAKTGGMKSKELGTNFTSWDKEKHKSVCSSGGKVSGKIPMWTNGVKNKRSHTQPDIDYFEGITKKHKITKQLTVYRYK